MTYIWKDVLGYEGLYEVSDDGQVKALSRVNSRGNRRKEKLMALHNDTDGYFRVRLTDKDGVRRTCKMHRVVAQAFIPNPNDLPEVNHKDGDKTNNLVSNLEWSTRSANVQHTYDSGLKERDTVIHNGVEISFRQLALQNGIRYGTAKMRVAAGWSLERAATEPTRKGNYS